MVIRAKNSGFGVAGLPWNPWLVSYGITGWFGVESVAGFPWNRWLVWHGIAGWFGMEYAGCQTKEKINAGLLK